MFQLRQLLRGWQGAALFRDSYLLFALTYIGLFNTSMSFLDLISNLV